MAYENLTDAERNAAIRERAFSIAVLEKYGKGDYLENRKLVLQDAETICPFALTEQDLDDFMQKYEISDVRNKKQILPPLGVENVAWMEKAATRWVERFDREELATALEKMFRRFSGNTGNMNTDLGIVLKNAVNFEENGPVIVRGAGETIRIEDWETRPQVFDNSWTAFCVAQIKLAELAPIMKQIMGFGDVNMAFEAQYCPCMPGHDAVADIVVRAWAESFARAARSLGRGNELPEKLLPEGIPTIQIGPHIAGLSQEELDTCLGKCLELDYVSDIIATMDETIYYGVSCRPDSKGNLVFCEFAEYQGEDMLREDENHLFTISPEALSGDIADVIMERRLSDITAQRKWLPPLPPSGHHAKF